MHPHRVCRPCRRRTRSGACRATSLWQAPEPRPCACHQACITCLETCCMPRFPRLPCLACLACLTCLTPSSPCRLAFSMSIPVPMSMPRWTTNEHLNIHATTHQLSPQAEQVSSHRSPQYVHADGGACAPVLSPRSANWQTAPPAAEEARLEQPEPASFHHHALPQDQLEDALEDSLIHVVRYADGSTPRCSLQMPKHLAPSPAYRLPGTRALYLYIHIYIYIYMYMYMYMYM